MQLEGFRLHYAGLLLYFFSLVLSHSEKCTDVKIFDLFFTCNSILDTFFSKFHVVQCTVPVYSCTVPVYSCTVPVFSFQGPDYGIKCEQNQNLIIKHNP